jgi:hypothetical protein
LATGSKEEAIHLRRVFDWFFFATSSQSETLFTNLIVNFNLQLAQSNLAIKIAIFPTMLQYSAETNIRFDFKVVIFFVFFVLIQFAG